MITRNKSKYMPDGQLGMVLDMALVEGIAYP
jgi:hypothetical protein